MTIKWKYRFWNIIKAQNKKYPKSKSIGAKSTFLDKEPTSMFAPRIKQNVNCSSKNIA